MNKFKIWPLALWTLVLWFSPEVRAAQPAGRDTTAVYRIYYYVDQSDLAYELRMNGFTLQEMDRTVDSLLRNRIPLSIRLVSGASPEGTEEKNLQLSKDRSERVRSYLLEEHARLQEKDIEIISMGADWEGLARTLSRSHITGRERAVRIIRRTPVWVKNRSGVVVDSRKKQLMDLQGGMPWRQMEDDIFPSLRKTEVSVTFPLPEVPQKPVLPDTVRIREMQTDTVYVDRFIKTEPPKHGFVLYTNLLHDVALVPSIGTQLYLGKGWMIDARWSGNWYSKQAKDLCWRFYGAELAVRKYFRMPQDNAAGVFRSSTGHHVGVYGLFCTYDFVWKGQGFLGGVEGRNIFAGPTWAAGVEYGYTLPLSRHFNMDFSIGAGYMEGPLQRYVTTENGYLRTGDMGRMRWWGPSRAEISLIWLIGFQNERR